MQASIVSERIASERRFYAAMALAIFVAVLVGFSRSFFLKPLFPGHPSPAEPVFYIHGALFTLWIVLFAVQVALITKQRADFHRKLGYAGAGLAIVMLIFGVVGAVTAANRPGGFVGISVPPLAFLAIPLFDMIMFPAFVVLGIMNRNYAQKHKRWMLLATINIITAAIARWPVVDSLGPLGGFGITDLFIVALAVWDYRSTGKLHPVTFLGGILTILSQPLRIAISGTTPWLAFAGWLTALLQ